MRNLHINAKTLDEATAIWLKAKPPLLPVVPTLGTMKFMILPEYRKQS
jgi:hypothetical protein